MALLDANNQQTASYLFSGVEDPSVINRFGFKGALYLRLGQNGGVLYQKQDDGSTPNWSVVGGTVGADRFLSNLLAPTAVNQDLNMGGNRITQLPLPSAGTDAASKDYVDAAIASPIALINAEAAARIAGDSALSVRIDNETAARQAADSALSGAIAAETLARIAGDTALQNQISALGTYVKESFTLTGADITNQYIDLSFQAVTDSVFASIGRIVLYEGEDYSLSVVSGKTRFSFIGPIATSGAEALVSGDLLRFQYRR